MEIIRISKGLLLALFFSPALMIAQEAPTPAEPAGKKPGGLRIWAMVFDEKAPIAIKGRSSDDEPKTLLEVAGAKPQKSPYLEIPSGKITVSLTQGDQALGSQEIELAENDLKTLLFYRSGGQVKMQVFQDPLPGQKNFPPTLRLLNFGTGRVAEVTLGPSEKISVPENTCFVSKVSKKGSLDLQVVLPDPAGGPAAVSMTDVDMGAHPSWSVLMIPDYRGKIRPRVSPDGRE